MKSVCHLFRRIVEKGREPGCQETIGKRSISCLSREEAFKDVNMVALEGLWINGNLRVNRSDNVVNLGPI